MLCKPNALEIGFSHFAEFPCRPPTLLSGGGGQGPEGPLQGWGGDAPAPMGRGSQAEPRHAGGFSKGHAFPPAPESLAAHLVFLFFSLQSEWLLFLTLGAASCVLSLSAPPEGGH